MGTKIRADTNGSATLTQWSLVAYGKTSFSLYFVYYHTIQCVAKAALIFQVLSDVSKSAVL